MSGLLARPPGSARLSRLSFTLNLHSVGRDVETRRPEKVRACPTIISGLLWAKCAIVGQCPVLTFLWQETCEVAN